jgi:serine/threonine-protein kinase
MPQITIQEEPQGSATSIYAALVQHGLNGRYTLDRFETSGPTCAVYTGTDQVLGRKVSIKLLRPFNCIETSRFEREVLALARLQHPHIVSVFDWGTTRAGLHYIVTESMEGRTLARILDEEGPLAPHRAAALAEQVCRALERAHAEGIVHRDIRPQSIFVMPGEGDQEHVKVTDLGFVKLVAPDPDSGAPHHDITAMGVIIGHPEYMPPEQFATAPIDGRADLYSLGVVLFELLCGSPPFGERDIARQCRAHLTDPPPPLEQVRPRHLPPVPAALGRIVQRALEKEPDKRFSSAEFMGGALRAAAGLPPLPAVRPVPAARGGVVIPIRPEILAAPTPPTEMPEVRRGSPWPLVLVLGLSMAATALAIALLGI